VEDLRSRRPPPIRGNETLKKLALSRKKTALASGKVPSQPIAAREKVRPDTELAWRLLKYFTRASIDRSSGHTRTLLIISDADWSDWDWDSSSSMDEEGYIIISERVWDRA
jgi:hypothetical protein